jgi:precorrin-6B methylase 1
MSTEARTEAGGEAGTEAGGVAASSPPSRPGQLVVVGTGLRTVGQMTTESIAWIKAADRVLYVVGDPVAERAIHDLNPGGAESLQVLYAEGQDRLATYEAMVERILACVRAGDRVCGVFYGHPGVFVYPSHEAVKRARGEGYSAVMLPGVSAEDCLFADIGIDPAATGCLSYEATDFLFNQRAMDPASALVLWQIGILGNGHYSSQGRYPTPLMPFLIEKLATRYPLHHEAIVYEAAVHFGCRPRLTPVALGHLQHVDLTAASTLFVGPAQQSEADAALIERLQALGVTYG